MIENFDSAENSQSARRLSALIQCPTVSIVIEEDRPQTKNPAFDQLHHQFKNLYPAVFSVLEKQVIGSYSLLLRWPGKDSEHSIVLAAHQDVVPAENTSSWNYAPFSGEISDSKVWGRGALDDKGSLCAILEACEDLINEHFIPAVDIYLCFSHNEETMNWGAPAIAAELEKRGLKPIFVLDEGGAIVENPLPFMRAKAAMIGITEKGVADIQFTARSTGGHAGTPPKKSPLGQLGALAASIEKTSPFKASISPALEKMLLGLAPCMKFPLNILFRFPRFFAPLLTSVLKAAGGEGRAFVQTSCAFTMAEGSKAVNVIPDTAVLRANLRLSEKDSLEGLTALLKKRSAKYGVELELLKGHEASPVSSLGCGWEHLCLALKKEFPNVKPIPYIMLAASDARHYCKISSQVFRFSPFEMSREQRKSIHGFNEYIEINNFEKGIRFYKRLICGLF